MKIFWILLYLTQLSYPAQRFVLTLTEDDLMGQENGYKTFDLSTRPITEKLSNHFYSTLTRNHLCFFLIPLHSAICGDELQDLEVIENIILHQDAE